MIRTLRTIYSWIGIFVMPWIIVIGLTGLYLNHSKAVNNLLDRSSYDESQFDISPSKRVVDEAMTREIAEKVWAIRYSGKIAEDEYHDRAVFILNSERNKTNSC